MSTSSPPVNRRHFLVTAALGAIATLPWSRSRAAESAPSNRIRVGAIGVSGVQSHEDEQIADVGAATIK